MPPWTLSGLWRGYHTIPRISIIYPRPYIGGCDKQAYLDPYRVLDRTFSPLPSRLHFFLIMDGPRSQALPQTALWQLLKCGG